MEPAVGRGGLATEAKYEFAVGVAAKRQPYVEKEYMSEFLGMTIFQRMPDSGRPDFITFLRHHIAQIENQ